MVIVTVGFKVGEGVGDNVGLRVGTSVNVGCWATKVVSSWAVFLGVSSSIVKVRLQGGVRALIFAGAAVLNSRNLRAVAKARIPVARQAINRNI